MAIVSGYQKMKDYIKQSSGYKLISRWANANTLECDDGKTLQSKVGGISGISSSLTANSTTQAASTNLTNQLYQNITQVSSELGGLSFGQDAEGNWGYKPSGADAVIPFSNPKTFFGLFEKISAKRDYYDAWISPSGGTITRDINTSGLYSGNILRVVRTQYGVLSFYALVPCYAKIYPDGEISEYQKDDLIFTVSSGGSDVLYTVEAIAK